MIKIYTPDSPEFAEIAKSITHVSKVHKRAYERNCIYAELAPVTGRARRNESPDKLR